jgi:hypothetical protein
LILIIFLGTECLSLASSRRQWQRLAWIELHIEGSENCCCPGIIAHEGDEIDQRAAAELP